MLSVEKFRVGGERVVWIGVIFSGRVWGIAFAFDRSALMKRMHILAEHLRKRGVSISLDVQPSDYPEKVFKVLTGEIDNVDFLPELSFEGVTPFEKKVYEWLTKNVKRGSVITYGSLAKVLNTSPRAVGGGAMKRNPYPIVVPCHRVVASDGIGYYSSGIEEKKFLLEIEGVKEWTS